MAEKEQRLDVVTKEQLNKLLEIWGELSPQKRERWLQEGRCIIRLSEPHQFSNNALAHQVPLSPIS